MAVRWMVVLATVLSAVLWPATAYADFPWHGAGAPADPYAYQDYLHASPAIDCRLTVTNAPSDLDCNDWKVTSKMDPGTPTTHQELGAVMGSSLDRAWDVTTGRPDIHIAVLDSGIRWDDGGYMSDLRRKVALNWAELPVPQVTAEGASAAGCNPAKLPARTTRLPSPGFPTACYDANGDGVFNVEDYANDPRVNLPMHAHFCCGSDNAANNLLTPEDLIEVFSCFDAGNGGQPVGTFISQGAAGPRLCSNAAQDVDNDLNGFPHDIAGWNFMEHTNDPYDEPHYNHGSGEARDSNAEAGNGGDIGTCPNCMVVPLKVGDSFIADANDFAQAVMYATDNGVSIIQEALGSLNSSGITQPAIDYAYRNGVTVIASAADEEAGHHNQPGSTENHTIVVNSNVKSELNGQLYDGINSIEDAAGLPRLTPPLQPYNSYTLLNGCTNYGGHTVLAVPSGSCSSEATGKAAGYTGLLYSEACNLAITVQHHAGCTRGVDISPNEVKQVLAGSADDINYEDALAARARLDSPADATSPCTPQSDAPSPPNNYGLPSNGGEHYKSIAGWDQYFGYGRSNANCAVRAVLAGTVPPEADITSPGWFKNLDPATATSWPVIGHVAANRAASYTYKVQIAYGVQPHEADWANITPPLGDFTSPVDGVIATITRTQVDAAFAAYNPVTYAALHPAANPNGDQTDWLLPPYTRAGNLGKNQIDEFTFSLRVQVTDSTGLTGEDRRSLQSHHDNGDGSGNGAAVAGFPHQLDTDGGSEPVMADLQGNNQTDLIFGTSSGLVHAIGPDGGELPGWPVHTAPLCDSALPDADFCPSRAREPAFSDPLLGPVAANSYAAVLRDVAVGDLDRTGQREVVVADAAGYVWAFEADGSVRPGFPTHVNFDYSRQGLPGAFNRDHDNRVQFGFFASPSLGDLNHDGRLEIVIGALDRHVYAFHQDGSPQAGFPVLLASPEKVVGCGDAISPGAACGDVGGVDPATHRVHLKGSAGAFYGTKIVSSPSIGDLLGDGNMEIVVGRNEEYSLSSDGGWNASTDTANVESITQAFGQVIEQANGRLYALFADGYCHGLSACPATPPDAVPANAYVPHWPVKVGILNKEILPTVGSGVDTPAALITYTCPVNNQPGLKVGVSAATGPSYVFQSNGQSCYGQANGTDGKAHDRVMGGTLQPGAGDSTDLMATSAFGLTAFGELNGPGDYVMVTPTAGILKAVDVVLADHQMNAQNQVTAWSLSTAPQSCAGPTCFHQGFPHFMNDLQFLSGPAIADLTGDGRQEILMGSASTDLRAIQPNGTDLPGWSKNTGDWTVDTPVVGNFGNADQAHKRVASLTRDGRLFVWETAAPPCAAASWPKARHDLWNTGEYETRAASPSRIEDLGGTRDGTAATLGFTAPHAYGACADVSGYEVRYSTTGPITAANRAQSTLLPSSAVALAASSDAGLAQRLGMVVDAGAAAVVAAGQPQALSITGLPDSGNAWIEVQAVNGSQRGGGNLGAISNNLLLGVDGSSGIPGAGGQVTSGHPNLPNTTAGDSGAFILVGVALLAINLRRRRRRRT